MDWSYVAGFLDGEGSIVKNGETDYRITVPQTHEGVLREIKGFTGLGSICKVYKRKPHWKDSWTYTVARQEDVLVFLKNTYPHLIVKKNLVQNLIPKIFRIVSIQRKKKLDLQKKLESSRLLRKKGLSYRAIGKKMKIDHGYARRLVLFRGKNK